MARSDELSFALHTYTSNSQRRCPGDHRLDPLQTPATGLICDVCSAPIAAGVQACSCRACNYDLCSTCARKDDSQREEEALDKLRLRMASYSKQAAFYADEAKQSAARKIMPERLVVASRQRDEQLLKDLLEWFKADLFRWTNGPACSECGVECSKHEGMSEARAEELRFGAKRVEAWRCATCNVVTRFPRFNDPAYLLETRHGRCGEWANCFTLCASALGFKTRLVIDWTDHVWSEAFLADRWIHCDPCEGVLDSPLMYEAGWGKKLTYIIAFSPMEVVDVTPRYTAAWATLLERRREVSEAKLQTLIEDVDLSMRKGSKTNPAWRVAEAAESAAKKSTVAMPAPLSKEELQGRISGSAAWRSQRGELGKMLPVRVQEDPCSYSVFATEQASRESDNDAGNAPAVAHLAGGAALSDVDGVSCVDFSVQGSYVEMASLDGDCQALLGDDLWSKARSGFTVEAWLRADLQMLSAQAHMNPVVSRHGSATGWELRLRRDGGAVFMATFDRKHYEVGAGLLQIQVMSSLHDGCMLLQLLRELSCGFIFLDISWGNSRFPVASRLRAVVHSG
eukprot:TRINITY_DN29718_c0_g1_i1.p1 TRINITY_DN29718_c0_g1~~TRINITY_DN29718_c0_g1_i1.p1  ORF type:complete len:568 (-),score=86.86 TRINITY_DN29718_c0_g1_i1:273-1976(-)